MQGDDEHFAEAAVPKKKPPWVAQQQRDQWQGAGSEREEQERAATTPTEQRLVTDDKIQKNKNKNIPIVVDVEDDESDEDEETVIDTSKKAQPKVVEWVHDGNISEVEVEEDDDDARWWSMSWADRHRHLVQQGQLQREREAADRMVRFAAAAVQWQERQRESQELLQRRFATVCGRNYKGDGPVLLEDNNTGRSIRTISDSGTNIDVMSYATAQHLHRCGLQYHKCPESEQKRYVVFGVERAREPILGYMHGNGLIGQVAVVNDVAANLISVTAFTKRGMVVTYTDKTVEIRKATTGEVVFVGPFDDTTGLYHLDLIHLMLAPGLDSEQLSTKEGRDSRLDGGGNSSSNSSGNVSFVATSQIDGSVAIELTTEKDGRSDDCSNSTLAADQQQQQQQQAPFKQAALLRGMRFHENLEHIPYSTMADNIASGTWTGLHKDLTPALMRELARRRDCVICGIARWNEDHPKGSGDRRYPVGHTVALDYQGKITPTSRNGETGEFVLTDLGSGFTKRYGERGDKTTVESALAEWCSYFLSFGHVVKDARHDSGSVEVGEKFKMAARKLGINLIPTAPGQPETRIERRIQTHKNDIAGILARTRLLGANDWDIASTHACLIRSTMRCAASKLQGDGTKSPYELVTGKEPRIDVFQKYGLGDIGVVKKAEAKRPGYGGHKNEAVQIIGMEVDDVKAVRVEFVESRTRARRGAVQKLYLRASEMSDAEQAARTATFTDNLDDGSVTFAIEGGGDVVVESVRQLAAQEMELAERSSNKGFDSTIAGRMLLRKDQQQHHHHHLHHQEDDISSRAMQQDHHDDRQQGSVAVTTRKSSGGGGGDSASTSDAEGGDSSKGLTMREEEEEQRDGDDDAAGDPSDDTEGRAVQVDDGVGPHQIANKKKKTQDQVDREESPEGWYWPWPSLEDDQSVANMAFWRAYLEANGMPTEDHVKRVYAFTASTGVTFEMDFDDDPEEEVDLGDNDGDGRETDNGHQSDSGGGVVGMAFATRATRQTRDATNPTQRMINNDVVLAEMWQPSMVKERKGIFATSHAVTKEYAQQFGVTRHVTARTTKRDNTLKTRFAIDGRHEIRQGKFPNRDALYSPAMDEELVRLSLQYAATLDMDIGKSDVVQCFTHNPMETARFKRKLIVYMDEYESGVPGGQYREFDSVSYGTADASSEWYINMSKELMGKADGMGLCKSVHHPCLFYKGSVKTEDLIMVSVATDDMLRLNLKTDKSRQAMADFKTALDKKWPVTHEDGNAFKEILGVAVERGIDNDIRCTQPAEMRKIREAFFGEGEVPEVLVPLHPDLETAGNETGGSMFEGDDDSEDAREERSTRYRSLLGKLGYIRITRLDVLHTLSVLAERAHRPARRDVHGLYWLAAYLLTTEHVPLTFHPVDKEDAMNAEGVLRWTLFGDCSWASRAGSASCIAYMVVNGTLRTAEQLERRPFTAPVVAKTGKQKGPAADSAAAGEMMSTVAVIKSGTAIRGMSEELAGVAEPQPSTERMPAGGAGASPLCTDNASNGITIASQTGKKAKGMRLLAREIAFVQFHTEEGSVEMVTVTSKQQRANPLTKAIRSASVHFREAEWLLGTSPELADMQALAEERGRSKKSLRPEVVTVAGFAGYGAALDTNKDTSASWAAAVTDAREIGYKSHAEVDAITKRNTGANQAPEGGRTFQIRARLEERRQALHEATQTNALSRLEDNRALGKRTESYGSTWHTLDELVKLIFRPDEWMIVDNTVDDVESGDNNSGTTGGDGGVMDVGERGGDAAQTTTGGDDSSGSSNGSSTSNSGKRKRSEKRMEERKRGMKERKERYKGGGGSVDN